ncbi:MAG TPA: hypothetical protein VND19_16680 [Acetobacteraceae bacterium]|nr:hypothetical protein [Acetobacteraceae bacterium]
MSDVACHPWRLPGRAGVASIEAALGIALVLVPLCLGVIGLGMALEVVDRLDRALQAAAFYAWANPGTPAGWGSADSASLAGARGAALSAYGDAGPSPTVTAAVVFYCVSGGYIPVQPAVSYATTCATGLSLAAYLTVAASTSVTPPGLPVAPAIPLSVTGTVRVQ